MGTIKEELQGMLTLSFEVPAAVGILDIHTPIRLTGINDYEVEQFVGPGQPDLLPHIGYVIVPNNKPNNDNRVVAAVRGRAVLNLTVGEAIAVGKLVTVDTAGKLIAADFREAQAGFKVNDFVWNGGETITVDTVVLTEGVEFVTGADIPTTAQNIANAIDANVPGFRANVEGGNQVVVSRDGNGPVFDQTIPVVATDDDGADIEVDAALAQDGDASILDPYGVMLESAAAPDDKANVLVF
nr:hypothetical protein 7 [bacterium]